jgi:hypothetical protein
LEASADAQLTLTPVRQSRIEAEGPHRRPESWRLAPAGDGSRLPRKVQIAAPRGWAGGLQRRQAAGHSGTRLVLAATPFPGRASQPSGNPGDRQSPIDARLPADHQRSAHCRLDGRLSHGPWPNWPSTFGVQPRTPRARFRAAPMIRVQALSHLWD